MVDKWEWEIILDSHWRPRWPRPRRNLDDTVVVITFDGEVVDLQAILGASQCHVRSALLQVWRHELKKLLGEHTTLPLTACLQHLSGKAKFHALLGQILLALATKLEQLLGQVAQGKVNDCDADFKWLDISDQLSGSSMDLKLAQYVTAGQHWIGGGCMWALGTDKGIVNRLPLRNSYLVQPSGRGVVCVPVVAI